MKIYFILKNKITEHVYDIGDACLLYELKTIKIYRQSREYIYDILEAFQSSDLSIDEFINTNSVNSYKDILEYQEERKKVDELLEQHRKDCQERTKL